VKEPVKEMALSDAGQEPGAEQAAVRTLVIVPLVAFASVQVMTSEW
jgi:hypothetical protein